MQNAPHSPHYLLLTGALLLGSSLSLSVAWAEEAGQVYTWKDANGQVHYGNRQPEGQNATSIPIQPSERIYTWTDAEGKTHYAGQAPPNVQAKELKDDESSLSTIHSGQLRSGERQLLRESE